MIEKPKRKRETTNVDVVYEYHDQTKHQLNRYARSLGYMDWNSQPDPFRRYDQALKLPLDHPPITETPTYDSLFGTWQESALHVNRESIGRLFYESLAISAWKQAGGSRWSLRVNPSSGDLHPTEAYLIAGPIKDLTEVPAVFHYSVYEHALERRVVLTSEEWDAIGEDLPSGFLLVALTSIYWRESWKYGERAFRYCHHDVGHAIGTVAFAAAALGWTTRLINSITDNDLGALLGLHKQEGIEVEHADCLLAIFPGNENVAKVDPIINLPGEVIERLEKTAFEGRPNRLSRYRHEWPMIDTVAEATRYSNQYSFRDKQESSNDLQDRIAFGKDRNVSARRIIRERRSALAMDGRSAISNETFYRMMTHVSPRRGNNLLDVLPWRAGVSLALFIHRVDGLIPGLYLLVRDPGHDPSLRSALGPKFRWQKPEHCPEFVNLYLLEDGDMRDVARLICCHQDIAADGAFAVSMLAEFDTGLEQNGPSFYPRLFWETGLVGQILYLEAEAAKIGSTGIGCFFDDAMHEVLGIRDHAWQSLYHFTVGGPVDDPRLQTLPSYWYLK